MKGYRSLLVVEGCDVRHASKRVSPTRREFQSMYVQLVGDAEQSRDPKP